MLALTSVRMGESEQPEHFSLEWSKMKSIILTNRRKKQLCTRKIAGMQVVERNDKLQL
jgi:hypothetical protein